MRKFKYVKLFENFMVKSGGREVEAISQIITFSLTDKSKSHFDNHTWIKKWETDMELKSDGSDSEERIKKIGEMKYFLDEFGVYFYYEDINERYPYSGSRFEDAPNQPGAWNSPHKEYKSNLEKILRLNYTSNQYSDNNFKQLSELPTKIFDLGQPGRVSPRTFLIGYGTIQTTEKVKYERFNYYCLVTVAFLHNFDESIELYPFEILLKESEPGQEEVVGVRSGIYCKIDREQWESGLKPGDTDHRGFFKITSVEDHLGILRADEKNVRKK
jgi:hypothetical protein